MQTSDKRNSFWLGIQYVIGLLFAIITLKINISAFGEEKFGVWLILSSIWGLTSALDFGFGTSIVKYVAEYNQYNRGKLNILLSSSFFVYCGLGLVTLTLGLIIGEVVYVSNSNFIGIEERTLFRTVYYILGGAFYLRFISIFFRSVFEGVTKFTITSKITISYNILLLCGILLVYLLGGSLIMLSQVYLISSFLLLILYYQVFRNKFNDVLIGLRYFHLNEIKKVFVFSFYSQGISIFSALIDPVIKFIIGNFYQVSFVTIYEIGRRVATSISGLFFNAFRTILPKTSILKTTSDYLQFFESDGIKYSRLGIIYSGLTFGIFLLPLVLFLKFWFGYEEAVLVFLILSLPASINNFGYTVYMFLIGSGYVSFIAFLQLINLIVITITMTFGFILFNNYFGIFGYFITIVSVNVIMLIKLKRLSNINIKLFLTEVKVYKLIINNLLIILTVLIYQYYSYNIYILVGIISLTSLIIYGKDLFHYSKSIRKLLALKL